MIGCKKSGIPMGVNCMPTSNAREFRVSGFARVMKKITHSAPTLSTSHCTTCRLHSVVACMSAQVPPKVL